MSTLTLGCTHILVGISCRGCMCCLRWMKRWMETSLCSSKVGIPPLVGSSQQRSHNSESQNPMRRRERGEGEGERRREKGRGRETSWCVDAISKRKVKRKRRFVEFVCFVLFDDFDKKVFMDYNYPKEPFSLSLLLSFSFSFSFSLFLNVFVSVGFVVCQSSMWECVVCLIAKWKVKIFGKGKEKVNENSKKTESLRCFLSLPLSLIFLLCQ